MSPPNKFAGKAKTLAGAERKLEQLGYQVWYYREARTGKYSRDTFDVVINGHIELNGGTADQVIDFYNRMAKLKAFM